MIQDKDAQVIQQLARKFGAKRVLLFGSSCDSSRESRDIDLAVSGIEPAVFFRFYADLMWALSKPLDLVDLDRDSLFTRMIRKEGVPIYEQAA